MTATKVKGSSGAARSRKAGLLVLALCALAGGGLLFLQGNDGQKRKIADLSETETLALVRDGTAYITDIESVAQAKFTVKSIRAIPANGGPTRNLVPPPRQIYVSAGIAPTFLSDDRDLLMVETAPPVRPPVTSGGFSGAFGGVDTKYLGDFALPASLPPPAPGEKRKAFPTRVLERGGSVTLWRIPRSGAAPTVTKLDTQGLFPGIPAVSHAGAAYWERPRKGTEYSITTSKGYYTVHHLTSDLMRSPLDGDPPQVVATGLWGDLKANDQLICWKTPGVFPDKSQTLHLLRVAEGANAKEYHIQNFRGNEYDSLAIPTEFDGRFYWTVPEWGDGNGDDPPPTLIAPPRRARLVSQKFDGTDYRVIVPAQDAQGADRLCQHLQIADGKLYMTFVGQGPDVKRTADGIVLDSGRRSYTARVFPDRGNALGKPIETTGFLDAGYCYFVDGKKAQGWRQTFDFLFPSADEGKTEGGRLVRIPLPE
jgi:hypothetical protein